MLNRVDEQPGRLSAALFDHGGTRLVTGGDDLTIHFWDVASWREVAMFHLPERASIKACEFTPDDTRLIVTLQDDSVQIWDSRDVAIRQQERDALSAERQAAQKWATKYVDALIADSERGRQGKTAQDLEKMISLDSAMSSSQRIATFDYLHQRFEEIQRLIDGAPKVLEQPSQPVDLVKKTLDDTARAASLWPTAKNLKYLGAAQYRVGQYGEALKTLERSVDPLSQWTRLFEAMAAYQAGDHEAARAFLAEAKTLRDRWGLSHPNHVNLFKEAESLIGGVGEKGVAPASAMPTAAAKKK